MVDSPDPLDCEGTRIYTYSYTDCAGNSSSYIYTYTIDRTIAPAEIGGPVATSETVECLADAVAPGTVYQAGFAGDFDPSNWTLSNIGPGNGFEDATLAPASVTLYGSAACNGYNETHYAVTIPVDGNLSFNWDYDNDPDPAFWDPFGYSVDGVFTQLTDDGGPTVQSGSVSINLTQGQTFALTAISLDGCVDVQITVTSVFLYTSPAFPVVEDVCGNVLSPVFLGNTSTYNGSEGTYSWDYLYTDCSGLIFPWSFIYTIDLQPSFNLPPNDYTPLECADLIVPPTPPAVNDNCGNPITPIPLPMGGTYDGCEGTIIYSWEYEDCANNVLVWSSIFDIQDNTPPWIIAPPDITVYVNNGCTATGFDLGLPQKGDNCSNALTVHVAGLVNYPLGNTTVTWTVEDCAGNVSAPDYQVVTVVQCALSGTMTYNNIFPFVPPTTPITPMNNVSLQLNGPGGPYNTTTDGSGNYAFPGLCAGNYTLTVTNINKPFGGVNVTDAAQANVWGSFSPGPYPAIEKVQWLAGDAANSGVVDGGDAFKMLAHFLTLGSPPYDFSPVWNFAWAGDLTTTNPPASTSMDVTIGGGNAVMDIYGQCTGDWNGSFTPDASKSSGTGSLTLNYGQYLQVTPDVAFELPLYAGMDMEVGAVSLILNFPADVVDITGAFLTSDPSKEVMYNVSGNELRIGWYSLDPVWLNEGDGLITLQMKLNSSTTADGIHFSLASDPLNELADGGYDVINDAVLEILVPTTSFLGIGDNSLVDNLKLHAQPNPFSGTTTLIYTVPANGQVTLEIYDMVGNKVQVAVDQTMSAGNYSLRLDAGSLQPGVYTAYLKLHNADNTVTRTIKLISR
jgi:hypothetical protein